MKIKNKKTGEIVEATDFNIISEYNSLAELNEDWEDYEEPKEFFAISPYKKEGYEVLPYDNFGHIYKLAEELGIAFKTKEEAEKAVEKLKAWKRLKDKGFRFNAWYGGARQINFEIRSLENEYYLPRQICDDLDLLFGGEE